MGKKHKHGQTWGSTGKYGQKWDNLGKHRHVWVTKTMVKFGQTASLDHEKKLPEKPNLCSGKINKKNIFNHPLQGFVKSQNLCFFQLFKNILKIY